VDDELRAAVRRVYRLPGKRLLLLEDTYEGGVEAGDQIEVALPDGRLARAKVDGVAWGSAFGMGRNPPLTLVVLWNDDPDPERGAAVRAVPKR
jgi:hypothetical protein